MKKCYVKKVMLMGLAVCLSFFLSCKSYSGSETVVSETTEVTVASTTEPTTEPTVTVSPTTAETTAKTILVAPIDTSIRTDLAAPTIYTVTGKTATGKTAVWKDVSRVTASRYLVAGDFVTVVAIVGNESRPYALLDTGEYVLLTSLEAVPVATATPTVNPIATPKPTKAPTKTPTATTAAPAATTAAPTDPPPATTAAPSYYPNAENIRNLIVGSLQAQGRWFPDATSTGGGSANVPVDYFSSDQKYADYFLGGKFPQDSSEGGVSITVTIENDYVVISCTRCLMPTT